MKHLGDITKINGADITPVNVVIGGSPCQDLSVAGKRAGLAGERSGLFMEQLRVIKEMRRSDENNGRTGTAIRPRFMVWENVPGAFSSNKGADFGAVLQETVRVVCKEAPTVPKPKNGWPTAGCLVDVEGHWSVAWRVFDAQFWGVPQRRRRIALVADFGGPTAPEILFERESVSGNSAQSGPARERTTAPFEMYSGTAGECDKIEILNDQGGDSLSVERGNVSPTLRNQAHGNLPIIAYATSHAFCTGSAQANAGILAELSTTLTAAAGMRGNNQPVVCQPAYCIQGNCIDRADTAGCNGKGWAEGVSYTLNTVDRPAVYDARGNGDGKTAPTITRGHNSHVGDYIAVVVNGGDGTEAETSSYSQANACKSQNANNTVRQKGLVRRLTPLECERLQGFPDGWTQIGKAVDCIRYEVTGEEYIDVVYEYANSSGKRLKTTDSARYKALGNSIALPSWVYVLQKLSLCCGTDHTMASLFDGIGGFPLIWESLHGKGSCLWASEIDEFPIAVTKEHFPEQG